MLSIYIPLCPSLSLSLSQFLYAIALYNSVIKVKSGNQIFSLLIMHNILRLVNSLTLSLSVSYDMDTYTVRDIS